MLSISEFSEMCQLPAQTLRFYHAEGLLVPAGVDERTGYRSYAFSQVERAMLIMTLRQAGLSVKDVRRVLDCPDETPGLLRSHEEALRRRRQQEDEAISDAHALIDSWPEVRQRHVPEAVVVSRVVPGGGDPYDWDGINAAVADTASELVKAVEPCGVVPVGTAWKSPAIETPEQKAANLTPGGPHWLVKVPVAGPVDALPDDVEVQAFAARDELSIFVPGRDTLAKCATAISRLLAFPLENAYVDLSRMRHILHEDGVETALPIEPLDSP